MSARVAPEATVGQPSEARRALLFPIAIAFTLGLILDRNVPTPLAVSLALGLVAGVAACRSRSETASHFLLAVCVAAGAAWYHVRHMESPWDVSRYAGALPVNVRLRGVLEVEPVALPVRTTEEPYRSWPPTANDETLSRTVVRVEVIHTEDGWWPAEGLVLVWLPQLPADLHPGDWVEISGLLERPSAPANPGEFDYAARLRALGIRVTLRADEPPGGIVRLAEGWPLNWRGWLAVVRSWGHRVLKQHLGEQSGVAGALLLGEGANLKPEIWDRYVRTGVVHVLAISGQHLVILGGFLSALLVALRVPGRRAVLIVAVLLFAYALLTGGRPPALRAALMVALISGGYLLWRPNTPLNTLAFAWLVVAIVDPSEIFDPGCQLSFLAVAVLHRVEFGGIGAWLPRLLRPLPPDDPLEQLEEETRPASIQMLHGLWRKILLAFYTTFAVMALVSPLVAARMHVVAPVGVLLGPPVVLLTSIILISGFLMLATAAVYPPLVVPFAWIAGTCLTFCDALVGLAERVPFGSFHVPYVPEWWLWGFYGLLFALMWFQSLRRPWTAIVLLGWVCVGLIAVTARTPSGELRCTFLAVGHGACVVLETPDGRVALYDAGSLAGPATARRQIAPFLWQRGIWRIDEVILSHADLDHFNGLPALLERFAVGKVTLTPSFAGKQSPGVDNLIEALNQREVAVRRVWAGHRLTAGEVEMQVLHPPEQGPEGSENARSLVLEIRYQERTILLTGDLEGAGLQRLLAGESSRFDVLLAPHHGSAAAKPEALAAWARPTVVISSQRRGEGKRTAAAYEAAGARFLGTDQHGAVTVVVHSTGMVVETFRSKQFLVVRR